MKTVSVTIYKHWTTPFSILFKDDNKREYTIKKFKTFIEANKAINHFL